MDRRDKSRRASSAPPSMVTLAAAATAGEEADNDGAVTHVDEDTKPLNLGGAMSGGSSSLSPTAAVPVSARRGAGGGGSGGGPSCQAERCGANLTDARQYYRRHKVCEGHAKAPVVIVAGLGQRFCQQCSRFHELSEFDDIKKSCRKRLAGHNERRRKRSNDAHGGGATGNGSGHTDQDGPSHPHSQLNNLHIR